VESTGKLDDETRAALLTPIGDLAASFHQGEGHG
jgi:hypothetical protein